MSLFKNISLLRNLPAGIAAQKIGDKIISCFKKNDLPKDSDATYILKPNIIFDNSLFSYNPLLETQNNRDEILYKANLICKHKFDLLGSGLVKLEYNMKCRGFEGYLYESTQFPTGTANLLRYNINPGNYEISRSLAVLLDNYYQPIDWQLDFKSGRRWKSKSPAAKIKYGDIESSDIKIPWELGRLQHLTLLAQAASIDSGNKSYFYEWINQILDFIAFNPPGFGVQWMSSMDISIRAVNILVSFDILKQAGYSFKQIFIEILNGYILNHLKHIEENDEYNSGLRGNHYLTNICSLFIIYAYMNEPFKQINKINSLLSLIKKEIDWQFYDDGANFEASTSYHRLSMELLLWSLFFANRLSKGLKASAISLEKKDIAVRIDEFADTEDINQIIKFYLGILNHKGNMPLFGDDDSGYFIRLIHKNIDSSILNDINANTLINTLLFQKDNNRDKFALKYEAFKETGTFEKGIANSYSINAQNYFKDSGIYVFKNDLYYFALRSGKPGQYGKGGHSHNDALSFVFSVNGEDIIVDSGTYVYTSNHQLRNLYRSVKSHNTLYYNDVEQNEWYNDTKDDLFWIKKDRTKAGFDVFLKNKVRACHYAYKEKCERTVQFLPNKINVMDSLNLVQNKVVPFHLAPGVSPEISDNNEIILQKGDIRILLKNNKAKVIVNDYKYSPSYGVSIKSKVLQLLTNEQQIDWSIEILE